MHKTCKCGLNDLIFAAMKQERIYKTVERISAKSGRVYRRAPHTPAPKFRGQRFTLLKDDLAQIRLELTEAEYKQVQKVAKDVSIAMGSRSLYSVPETIIEAITVSQHVLNGNTFTQMRFATLIPLKLSDKKPAGRPVKFKNGKANVVLKMHYGIAMLLNEKYNDYCELNGVAELPRTGPVWAAFLHGVEVIRAALGRG